MESAQKKQITLVAHSFSQNNGGIAKVARLMAQTIGDLKVPASLIELSGDDKEPLFGIPKYPCLDSKFKVLQLARKHSSKNSYFVFDSPNRTRLVPWLWPRKIKTMTFCHGIELWEQASSSAIQAARQSDILLCNSNYTKSRACSTHRGLDSMIVCPLATEEIEAPSPAAPLKNNTAPIVLMVGRMDSKERYKGHKELIHAWPEVANAIPGAQLKIIGSGDDFSYFKRMAESGPASQQIHLLGKVPEIELHQHYSAATLFAMPSRNEGFGLVYIEAMQHGLPVLVSRQDAGQELFEDGITGLTVNMDHPGELARKLIMNLKDPASLEKIGQRGQEKWQQCYSYLSFRETFGSHLKHFISGINR